MGTTENESRQPVPENVAPLLAPLQALQDLITRSNNRGVIIGGIAASLLGTPRYTVDLDAVILLVFDDLPGILQTAAELGIQPRTLDPIEFARKNRILLMRHTASGTDIDISLGILLFELEMIERSLELDFGAIRLRLPTPEDLIIMKAVVHRPKDLADIEGIAESHPNLDRGRIRYWVDQFGEALDMPELWGMIEGIIYRLG